MTSRKNTPKPLPTQDRLRKLLDYDHKTGTFTWKARRRGTKIGDVAGYVANNGYCHIRIDGTLYLAHRLAFAWMLDTCADVIDHIDRNPKNNAWSNLRAATISQNNGNSGVPRNNTSGVKGVFWNTRRGKWQAAIQVNGDRKHLGYFTNISDAAATYRRAAIGNWGEFANLVTS